MAQTWETIYRTPLSEPGISPLNHLLVTLQRYIRKSCFRTYKYNLEYFYSLSGYRMIKSWISIDLE
jgi:hypothetical protein